MITLEFKRVMTVYLFTICKTVECHNSNLNNVAHGCVHSRHVLNHQKYKHVDFK